MGKLSLIANPTFKSKVGIPVAGEESVDVLVTFKHRTKTALDEFIKSRADQSDVDSFMAMVSGWDLIDEFNKENVEILLENHIGAALAVYRSYVEELLASKIKN